MQPHQEVEGLHQVHRDLCESLVAVDAQPVVEGAFQCFGIEPHPAVRGLEVQHVFEQVVVAEDVLLARQSGVAFLW